MKLIRTRPGFARLGLCHSAGYVQVGLGLLPRPVRIGERATAFPEHELDAVIAARIAGCTDDEVRSLVERLHEQRKVLGLRIFEAAAEVKG